MTSSRSSEPLRRGRSAAGIAVSAPASGVYGATAPYVAMVLVITACCVAIEFFAPEHWRPGINWLIFAPAIGLVIGGIPALVAWRHAHRIQRHAGEQGELIGLLLRDYAAERGDWIWSCDAEGCLRGVGEKFAAQVGMPISKLEGVSFVGLLKARGGDDRAALDEIAMCMRQRKPFFDIEARMHAGSIEHRWRLAGKPTFRDGRFAGFVGTASDITTEVQARETMTFLAYNDSLTGLSNRSHFTKRLNECVARLERYGSPFTVLYLDLDKFKLVNDSRGHQAGDRLLVEVGRRLGALVRETDLVARLGGDEFAMILTEDTEPVGISQLASRLIAQVSAPYAVDGEDLVIGLSVGIAVAPINGTRPDQILRNSDLALYRAKEQGGNRFCFFENRMDADVRERRMLELELGEALDHDEFELYYQPVINAGDGTVSGFEALIRWNHPIRGLVPPSEFIPISERSSLIGRIGEWTIHEACRMLARLPERYTVAVNLSTKHFRTADISALVESALKETGVAPHRLELEITESLLIDNPEEMALKLHQLKRAGIKIAMDDFGTGYSSLSYLLKFPFDKIKIDRSFVTASSEDPNAREILKAIVGLAQTLNILVTSEGVETPEQARFLKELGSNLLQGYLFSRPLPEAKLPEDLAAISFAGLLAPRTDAGDGVTQAA